MRRAQARVIHMPQLQGQLRTKQEQSQAHSSQNPRCTYVNSFSQYFNTSTIAEQCESIHDTV